MSNALMRDRTLSPGACKKAKEWREEHIASLPQQCWVGITATNTAMFESACRSFWSIDARIRYISFEPLLESINIRIPFDFDSVDWVIIGACTGTKSDMEALCQRNPELTLMPWGKKWTAQPRLEWVREIVEVANRAEIPVFLKDNLIPIMPENTYKSPFHFGIHGLRQEVPE